MAEVKSVFDQIDDEAEAQAIAEAELDAGKGIPHERVREWLLKLARGEITPPPCEQSGRRRRYATYATSTVTSLDLTAAQPKTSRESWSLRGTA